MLVLVRIVRGVHGEEVSPPLRPEKKIWKKVEKREGNNITRSRRKTNIAIMHFRNRSKRISFEG